MTVIKTISIPNYLENYIKNEQINLSRFVQDKLKERMILEGKYNKYKEEEKK